MNISNLRLRPQPGAAFLAMLLLAATLGAVDRGQLGRLGAATDDVTPTWLPSVQTLQKIRYAVSSMRRVDGQSLLGVYDCAVAAAAMLAVWTTNMVTGPMAKAVHASEAIACGNLPLPTHSLDETGQLLHALSRMKDSLARAVASGRQGADSRAGRRGGRGGSGHHDGHQ